MTKENLVRKIKEQLSVIRSLNIEIEIMEKIMGTESSLKIENIDVFDDADETCSYKSLVHAVKTLDDITKFLVKALNVYFKAFNSHTTKMLERTKDER